MKLRNAREYSSGWVQTVVSVVSLLFVILVSFGVLTPEQSAEVQPLITTTLGAVSSAIAGIIAIIGILFKDSTP
jgi:protein-S-isoprenylcysteine O-methyltransferase Ste14